MCEPGLVVTRLFYVQRSFPSRFRSSVYSQLFLRLRLLIRTTHLPVFGTRLVGHRSERRHSPMVSVPFYQRRTICCLPSPGSLNTLPLVTLVEVFTGGTDRRTSGKDVTSRPSTSCTPDIDRTTYLLSLTSNPNESIDPKKIRTILTLAYTPPFLETLIRIFRGVQ